MIHTDATAAQLEAENQRLRQRVAELEQAHAGPVDRSSGNGEASFESLFRHSSTPMLILDETGFIDCNAAAIALLRAPSKASIVQTAFGAFSPDTQPDGRASQEKAAELMAAAFADGPQCFEWMHRHFDGTALPVEVMITPIPWNGKPVLHVSWRDLTQYKQTEAEVRKFQAIIAHAPDAIAAAGPDSCFTYTNPAFQALFGDPMLGRPASDQLSEAGKTQNPEVGQSLMTQGFWRGLIECQRVDGSTFPGHIALFMLTDAQGQLTGFASITRDMSAQQEQEQERLALQAQVIAAQQAALRELSTPLIPLADNVVAMPLIGSVDSGRAQQVVETLLSGVAEHRASTAIIDITGVPVVDTQVANALIHAAQAVQLLGAQVVLTGIRPEVAQTLVGLNTDLRGITTRSTLQDGITHTLAQRARAGE